MAEAEPTTASMPAGEGAGREETLESVVRPRRDGPHDRRKRPVSVTLVTALALAVAVYSLVSGTLAIRSGDPARLFDGVAYAVFGAGVLVAAFGAFRMRPWGWAAFMTWNVIALTNQVLQYLFFESPNYLDMAINTFVVLALSPLEVQIAFGLRHTENVQLARPTRNPLDNA